MCGRRRADCGKGGNKGGRHLERHETKRRPEEQGALETNRSRGRMPSSQAQANNVHRIQNGGRFANSKADSNRSEWVDSGSDGTILTDGSFFALRALRAKGESVMAHTGPCLLHRTE